MDIKRHPDPVTPEEIQERLADPYMVEKQQQFEKDLYPAAENEISEYLRKRGIVREHPIRLRLDYESIAALPKGVDPMKEELEVWKGVMTYMASRNTTAVKNAFLNRNGGHGVAHFNLFWDDQTIEEFFQRFEIDVLMSYRYLHYDYGNGSSDVFKSVRIEPELKLRELENGKTGFHFIINTTMVDLAGSPLCISPHFFGRLVLEEMERSHRTLFRLLCQENADTLKSAQEKVDKALKSFPVPAAPVSAPAPPPTDYGVEAAPPVPPPADYGVAAPIASAPVTEYRLSLVLDEDSLFNCEGPNMESRKPENPSNGKYYDQPLPFRYAGIRYAYKTLRYVADAICNTGSSHAVLRDEIGRAAFFSEGINRVVLRVGQILTREESKEGFSCSVTRGGIVTAAAAPSVTEGALAADETNPDFTAYAASAPAVDATATALGDDDDKTLILTVNAEWHDGSYFISADTIAQKIEALLSEKYDLEFRRKREEFETKIVPEALKSFNKGRALSFDDAAYQDKLQISADWETMGALEGRVAKKDGGIANRIFYFRYLKYCLGQSIMDSLNYMMDSRSSDKAVNDKCHHVVRKFFEKFPGGIRIRLKPEAEEEHVDFFMEPDQSEPTVLIAHFGGLLMKSEGTYYSPNDRLVMDYIAQCSVGSTIHAPLPVRRYHGNPMKTTGFLRKEGEFFKNWKKRMFKITGSEKEPMLSYYENENAPNPIKSLPIKTSTCSDADEKNAGDNRQFCFKLRAPGRVLYMSAESEAQRRDWVGALQTLILKLNWVMEPVKLD